MAVTFAPIHIQTANAVPQTITAANTARDGSGSLVTLITAGTNGTRVDSITFTNNAAAVGASVLKVVRVFLTDNSGLNPQLIQEALLPLITSSNTVLGATVTINFPGGLFIKSGQIVKVAQSLCATTADNSSVWFIAADY